MSIRRKAAGVVRILRPELPLAAAVCVLLGEALALGSLPPVRALVPGCLCGFFLSASALVTNDYFDLEVDRINAPGRPLPAGLLSPPEAMALGLLLGLLGLAAAWLLGPLALVPAVLLWSLGFLYNWRLKSAGLWGNLIVSTSVGGTFILGGIAVGQAWNPLVWVFAGVAFFFDLAEEIAGDAMDAEGDQQRASRSIAIVWGKRAALRLSAVLFGLVILLTLLPVALGWLGWLYLAIISLTDLLIVFFTARLVTSQTTQAGHKWMRFLYICASIGLLAFLLSSFFA
jgi:geranylgeranylglycerol-phosphate geranylgeranyltransferase